MRFALVLLVALSGLFASSGAHAEGHADLSWTRTEAADTCATRSEIERRVRERLGRDPFSNGAEGGALSLEGIVDRTATGAYRARIFAKPAGGPRTPRELLGDDKSCRSLDDAVVLAIALAIDPAALSTPLAAPAPPAGPLPELARANPAPVPPAQAPTLAPIRERERDTPAASAPARLRGELAARGTILGNVLPRASLGVGMEGRLGLGRHISLTLSGQVQPEIREGDYAFGLSAGGGGACAGTPFGPRVRLEGCGQILVGGIHAIVYRLEPTEPGQRVWVAATLGAALQVRLVGPLGIEASAFGLASLVRPRFFVSGTNATVFEVPAGGYGGTLGLFARL